MKAVQIINGTGVPLKRSDDDTEQIIPAVWLKQVERTGFEKGPFSAWRDEKDFVLNELRQLLDDTAVDDPRLQAHIQRAIRGSRRARSMGCQRPRRLDVVGCRHY